MGNFKYFDIYHFIKFALIIFHLPIRAFHVPIDGKVHNRS